MITSAGLVLAGTFSTLAVLPLTALTEIGFTIAVGVLIDTFIVRSLLVPALVLDIGDAVWWPSALARGAWSARRRCATGRSASRRTDDDSSERGNAMNKINSSDGTEIAFIRVGEGPPVIMIGGAFSWRTWKALVELGGLLSARFTVLNDGRRGRGDRCRGARTLPRREAVGPGGWRNSASVSRRSLRGRGRENEIENANPVREVRIAHGAAQKRRDLRPGSIVQALREVEGL